MIHFGVGSSVISVAVTFWLTNFLPVNLEWNTASLKCLTVFHWDFCFYCWWYGRCYINNGFVPNVIDLPLMSRSLRLDLVALLLLDKSLGSAHECRWAKQRDDGEVTLGNLTPFKSEYSLVFTRPITWDLFSSDFQISFPFPIPMHKGFVGFFFFFLYACSKMQWRKKIQTSRGVQEASTTLYTKK